MPTQTEIETASRDEIIRDQVDTAKDVAESLHSTMQHGYKAAVLNNCPSQITLLKLMEDAHRIEAELANLSAILEGRATR